MYSLLRSVKLDEIALKNEAVLMKLISQKKLVIYLLNYIQNYQEYHILIFFHHPSVGLLFGL